MSIKLSTRVSHRLRRDADALRGWLVPRHRALRAGAANSLASRERLRGLQSVAAGVARRRVLGDVVECGVYRGGSASVIAQCLPQRPVWLFDVFSGMPEPGPNDSPDAWDDVGKFVSSEALVRQTFAEAGVPTEDVHFVVGRYDATLPNFAPQPIAFLHLDCDWYDSVKLCLDTFYDAVVPGGAVVFDDYGHWSGCRKAVDEFLAERNIRVRLTPLDYTSHYFVKPSLT